MPNTQSTVTVDVIPKIDTAAIDSLVREAVADSLRRLADSLTERAGANPTPTAPKGPRYYVEQINGIWGIRDREVPDEWAAFTDPTSRPAEMDAADLNAGADRRDWKWSRTGED